MGQSTERPAPTVLQAFLAPGLGEHVGEAATVTSPAALAVMLADLAARFAAMPALPDGVELRLGVDLQPITYRLPDWHREAHDAERVAVVDSIAAALLPGVPAQRKIMAGRSVHYRASGRTPAGLVVDVHDGVAPNDVERAAMDAEAVARVEPAAAEGMRAEFAAKAADAGHGVTIERGGKMDAPSLVRAVCACGDYRSGVATEAEARRAWRMHAGAAMEADANLQREAGALGHSPDVIAVGDTPGVYAVDCSGCVWVGEPGERRAGMAAWLGHAGDVLAAQVGRSS